MNATQNKLLSNNLLSISNIGQSSIKGMVSTKEVYVFKQFWVKWRQSDYSKFYFF